MMMGKVAGVPIRVHALLPMMALLSVALGQGQAMLMLSLAVLLHEVAHALAARLMNTPVEEIELLPFGGAARLKQLWTLRPSQQILVALAGPVCNLLLMSAGAALGFWGLMRPVQVGEFMKINLALMLFNLLPALPLDGGRVLCALLSPRLGTERAVRVGIWMGRALAGVMALAAAWGLTRGTLNLTLVFGALYLCVSANREKFQASGAAMRSLADRSSEIERQKALPVTTLCILEGLSPRQAAAMMRPGRVYRFLVVNAAMQVVGMVEDREIFKALMRDDPASMGEMVRPALRRHEA